MSLLKTNLIKDKLKHVKTILVLALWKMRIDDNSLKENATGHQKKIKIDESSIRQQCCVTSMWSVCFCSIPERKLVTAATRTIE